MKIAHLVMQLERRSNRGWERVKSEMKRGRGKEGDVGRWEPFGVYNSEATQDGGCLCTYT